MNISLKFKQIVSAGYIRINVSCIKNITPKATEINEAPESHKKVTAMKNDTLRTPPFDYVANGQKKREV